jgi:hypothetical protein
MASEILPELPSLPTAESWMRDTAVRGQFRSAPLKQLDTALQNYETSGKEYNAIRKAYNEGTVEFSEAAGAFDLAARKYGATADAFNTVATTSAAWGPSHPSRNTTNAVDNLRNDIDTGSRAIEAGRQSLRQASLEFDVPKKINLIWVGGPPPDPVLKAARIWAHSQPGAQVNVWVDRNNLLGSDFRGYTAGLRKRRSDDVNAQNDTAVDERIKTWKDDRYYRKGLDEKIIGLNDTVFRTVRNGHLDAIEKFAKSANGQFNIRDVSELWQHQGKPLGPDALTAQDRQDLQKAYQREVGERLNFGAASDIVRLVVLHDEPGQYRDVDVLPPIRGLNKLFDAWNSALNDAKSQRNPNANTLELSPQRGLTLLRNPSYVLLIKAVEEHIATIHPDTIRGALIGPPPQQDYNDLLKSAGQFGGAKRVQAAFDAWSGSARTLRHAFEEVPKLQVGANRFKALQVTATGTTCSNAALATSTAGAGALAEWARAVVRLSNNEAQSNTRKYYSDCAENRGWYRDITINTTGPATLKRLDDKFPDKLRTIYGVSSMDSDRVKIPYTHAPNPSTAELKSDWIKISTLGDSAKLEEAALGRTGAESSRLSASAVSSRLPQRRSGVSGSTPSQYPHNSSQSQYPTQGTGASHSNVPSSSSRGMGRGRR